MKEILNQINKLSIEILTLNQTIGGELQEILPKGFMPPDKREKIIQKVQEIAKFSSII